MVMSFAFGGGGEGVTGCFCKVRSLRKLAREAGSFTSGANYLPVIIVSRD
jgi:hypothetical protein